MFDSPRFYPRHRIFEWDSKFAVRNIKAYTAEDKPLPRENDEAIIQTFLEARVPILHPTQYNYIKLQRFLEKANAHDLTAAPGSSQHGEKIALVDDRCDQSGGPNSTFSTRNWDAYVCYPPGGNTIWSKLLDSREFYARLGEKRQGIGAERRTIYIANLTPLCALAIAATASIHQAPILRDFLHRHISHRESRFSMEFHLPYHALRKHTSPASDPRLLRRSGLFIPISQSSDRTEYFHEAQISFIVTGIDEWYWTAYCCADTYFGSEETAQFYLNEELDAPSGAGKSTTNPVWNPREYFLLVLSRRMNQIRKEWDNLITSLDDRLGYHEESIFNEQALAGPFVDDSGFSRTKEYTWTVQVLQLFHDSLERLIQSWDNFQNGESGYFNVKGNDTLQRTWEMYLASTEKDVRELRTLQTSLKQRIEMFDRMRNGVSILLYLSTIVEDNARGALDMLSLKDTRRHQSIYIRYQIEG
ncbi:MAG: hypothetical protein M1827_005624 [Pycnora praestabilis]|nr:MAG: hypothetical protein M1827_005624 [Pycnora praestabilis]